MIFTTGSIFKNVWFFLYLSIPIASEQQHHNVINTLYQGEEFLFLHIHVLIPVPLMNPPPVCLSFNTVGFGPEHLSDVWMSMNHIRVLWIPPPTGPTTGIHCHLILSPDSADRLQTTIRQCHSTGIVAKASLFSLSYIKRVCSWGVESSLETLTCQAT